MNIYEIDGKDGKERIEAENACAALTEYMDKHGGRQGFVLLYTEHNKNDGWEAFLRGESMFDGPRFAFVKKVKAHSGETLH